MRLVPPEGVGLPSARINVAIGLAASFILIGWGPGSANAQEPEPTRVDDIVVDGRPLEARVEAFVDAVIAPPVGRGPARWNDPVCVGVVNIQRDAAQQLVDQVSSVALRVGLGIGEPGCSPNVLIIGTEDGAALATALVSNEPLAFRGGYSGGAASGTALERFQTTDAAVRWWHGVMPTVRDTGLPAVRLPGQPYPLIKVLPGRLRTEIQNNLQKVIVILDLTRAEGRSFAQLGDYIGMIALVQVDPDADTSSHDTILNLFQPNAAPGLRLTDWDASFLEAVYGAELNQSHQNSQFRAVIGGMTRLRTEAGQDDITTE